MGDGGVTKVPSVMFLSSSLRYILPANSPACLFSFLSSLLAFQAASPSFSSQHFTLKASSCLCCCFPYHSCPHRLGHVFLFFSLPVFWQVNLKSHKTMSVTIAPTGHHRSLERVCWCSAIILALRPLGYFAPGCSCHLWLFDLCFARWEGRFWRNSFKNI